MFVAALLVAACASSSPSSVDPAETFWCAEHPDPRSEQPEPQSEEWQKSAERSEFEETRDPDGRHPERSAQPYRLPFHEATPRLLAQGSGDQALERQDVSTLGLGAGGLRARSRSVGGSSHRGAGRHAFDFAMPIGTPVLAARRGVVDCVGADALTLLHADGTRALYGHLSRVDVQPGEWVDAKSRLGESGGRGVGVPHLHFSVLRREGASAYTTVPIRFADGSEHGFVPRAGEYYGAGGDAP